MVLKCHHNYLKAIRKASITSFKKKRSETNSFLISDQCKIDDNKLSIKNSSNIKGDSQTQFWNKGANQSNSDLKEGNNNDINDRNLEEEYFKIKKEASPKVLK